MNRRYPLRRPQGLGAPPVPPVMPRRVPIFNPAQYGAAVPPQAVPYRINVPGPNNPPPMPGFTPIPPHMDAGMKELGRIIEAESNRDLEVVIPLNHWSSRTISVDADADGVVTFRSPLFDFWYDHLKEEAFPSGQYVAGAGGSSPAPGTSPTEAYQWQNHIFDYTLKIVGTINSMALATLTLVGAMHLQSPDEPFTINTITATNDLAKSPATFYMSGRVPMRFMQFRWAITMTNGQDVAQADAIQQMSVRRT